MRNMGLFLLTLILLTNFTLTKGEGDNFQKINVKITELVISKYEGYPANETLSVFELKANVRIDNPNSNPLKLQYGSPPTQLYATNLTARLTDRKINWYFKCFSGGMFQVEVDLYIEPGETLAESVSYLHVKKGGLECPPDGRYIIWIYLDRFGETLLNSSRTLLRVENGIPSFDFDYTFTFKISSGDLIIYFCLITTLMLVNYLHFKKKNK